MIVTVQTVPCTSLHGIGADEVMVSGYLVFAPLRSVLNMRHWRIAPLSLSLIHICREFVNSIGNRDYTLIMGLTVFMGIVVIGINLLTDLLCAWLDPRVRRACR